MTTFNDRESKVLSFMEQVQEQKVYQEEEDAFQNSVDYKLKTLDKCQDDAKNICLDKIFSKLYRDALPLGADYKCANPEDLDAAFKDFMAQRCPNGIEFYVKEGLKKGSPYAKKVLEAVDNLVADEYHDKAMNIEDYDAKDLVFNSSDDLQKKLDVIDLGLNNTEIAQAVNDNVKQTALSEITRAKKEKERIKDIETQLANDVNINTEESVKTALELRDIGTMKDYVPTLFEAVMINKLNKVSPKYESGELQETYLYDALDSFKQKEITESTDDKKFATPEDLAFVEAVKEYTGLSLLKALKLESYNKYSLADLAQDYAQARF